MKRSKLISLLLQPFNLIKVFLNHGIIYGRLLNQAVNYLLVPHRAWNFLAREVVKPNF
jgi:hypothetical protein